MCFSALVKGALFPGPAAASAYVSLCPWRLGTTGQAGDPTGRVIPPTLPNTNLLLTLPAEGRKGAPYLKPESNGGDLVRGGAGKHLGGVGWGADQTEA